ncbi:MAG TPA: hypothetical protein VHQ41_01310 [Patescibacteria group bacterium]|jgi:hypothetical protein|nr:hypothetical protein [Patescibacteria group bacterium]
MARKDPETIIEWRAPEFRDYPKNAAWFIISAVVIALLIIYQILQKDWFGAISVAIISGMFGAFALHRPSVVTVKISTLGLHIDDTQIPYNNIKQFWIVDTEDHKTLNIETTAYLNHELSIELEDQDADEVHDILSELLPEKEDQQETVAQKISHRIKF